MKSDITPGVIGLHGFSQQAVKRKSLVIAPRHQAFHHKSPHLLHGDTPDDQGIEAVEGTENALYQPAAFRRVGIGIGHVGEIGRQSRRAMHGDGITFGRRRRPEFRRRQQA
jgi:hypothetical protein